MLSQFLNGDALQPVWDPPTKNRQQAQRSSQDAVSRIQIHTSYSWWLPKPLRILWETGFYIVRGIQLHFRRRYDVVIAFGTTKTAVAGWLLARILRAKFIIEVPVLLEKVYLLGETTPGLLSRIRCHAMCGLGRIVLPRADRLRLMFPSQVDYFSSTHHIPKSVFHDFVPVHQILACTDKRFILAMGSPLYLKGADLAIKAFLRIADEFHSHRLMVVGYAPDKQYFVELAARHPRIHLSDHVPHRIALKLIARATCVVIASRTDAMPRLAIEAMAAGKPVIASSVDGLPYYLNHGINGILFAPGDVAALAEQLRNVLADEYLARSLADRGRDCARESLSEKAYAQAYKAMIVDTLTHSLKTEK